MQANKVSTYALVGAAVLSSIFSIISFNENSNYSGRRRCFDTIKIIDKQIESCDRNQTITYVSDMSQKYIVCRCDNKQTEPAVMPKITIIMNDNEPFYDDLDGEIEGDPNKITEDDMRNKDFLDL